MRIGIATVVNDAAATVRSERREDEHAYAPGIAIERAL
jgi:hypothetical protein